MTAMKQFLAFRLTSFVCGGFLLVRFSCSADSEPAKSMGTNAAPGVRAAFSRFVTEKRLLAEIICKAHEQRLSSTATDFFAAAQKGDWMTTSNLFSALEAANHSSPGGWLPPVYWGAVHETYGVYELLHVWNPELLERFGDGVVNSIPAGSSQRSYFFIGKTDWNVSPARNSSIENAPVEYINTVSVTPRSASSLTVPLVGSASPGLGFT
jgi:hypothetical protein